MAARLTVELVIVSAAKKYCEVYDIEIVKFNKVKAVMPEHVRDSGVVIRHSARWKVMPSTRRPSTSS